MRRILLAIAVLITVSVAELGAQGKIAPLDRSEELLKSSVIVYGGYNFLENTPLVGGAVALDVSFFRMELEGGWSYANTSLNPSRKNFGYFSPTVGVVFGKKFQYYLMGGATTWAMVEKKEVTQCSEDRFFTDDLHFKVKTGFNITFGERIFLNIEGGYMFLWRRAGYDEFPNAYARIGLGYRF